MKKVKKTKKGYDFIIIGAGVAGLAAAMYGARLGLKTLVLGASHGSEMPVGGVITTTNIVENYPGFVKLTGNELAEKLEKHAESYGLTAIKEEKVSEVNKKDKRFNVKTEKGTYEGKAILFATGTKWRKLEVPGGKEFENKGVNYCALCQPPGEDIVANNSLIDIEKISPSTKALTLDGTFQKVGGFSRRRYEGELISVVPRFFTEPVKLTPNHPVLTMKVDGGKSVNYKKNPEFGESEWKNAGELEDGDCVLYPIINEVRDLDYLKFSDHLELRKDEDAVIPHKQTHTSIRLSDKIKVDADLLRLFGYYLADGSAVRHELRFYFNKKELDYIHDIANIIKRKFKLEPRISYRANVATVALYSKVICDLFKVLFDKYSYRKYLPHFMMLLPKEKQGELVKGFWRGDGCMREKDFCFVTNSKKLTYQLRDVLLRLGIIPSVQIRKKNTLNKKNHKIEGRDVSFTKDKYHINVGGQFLEKISKVLGVRHPELEKRKTILKHAWINDGFAVLPIRKIEKNLYNGEVLSIGVENNNSYVAKNFIVHNCDGPLYKNKIVAVIGGSDAAAKDALLLAGYAKKVYIIYRGEKIHPEPINLKRVEANKKIEVINNTNITEVKGEQFVKSVVLDKEYKGKKELELDGVFVAIGHIVLSDLAKKLGVKLNKNGEIIINHKTSETNVGGVFAAGDVADKPFKQAITGVAEGTTAAHSAYEYIKK